MRIVDRFKSKMISYPVFLKNYFDDLRIESLKYQIAKKARQNLLKQLLFFHPVSASQLYRTQHPDIMLPNQLTTTSLSLSLTHVYAHLFVLFLSFSSLAVPSTLRDQRERPTHPGTHLFVISPHVYIHHSPPFPYLPISLFSILSTNTPRPS